MMLMIARLRCQSFAAVLGLARLRRLAVVLQARLQSAMTTAQMIGMSSQLHLSRRQHQAICRLKQGKKKTLSLSTQNRMLDQLASRRQDSYSARPTYAFKQFAANFQPQKRIP